jgi:hypothetical protein
MALISLVSHPRRGVDNFADRRDRIRRNLDEVQTSRTSVLASIVGIHNTQVSSVMRNHTHYPRSYLLISAEVRCRIWGTTLTITWWAHKG